MSSAIKTAIADALEDILGEYVLNISKENLKMSVFKGKLKLDNVILDGDAIGSHILHMSGLSGFAVLSCHAKQMRVTMNWAALEKEPIRMEFKGVNLLCVPLLPSTARKRYGSEKLTLRTRAKRSALSRLERNFFLGKMEDEVTFKSGSEGNENESEDHASKREDWMTRFKQKAYRNIEMALRDVHIRCESPEGAMNYFTNVKEGHDVCRAFSFGVSLESFIVRTSTANWSTDIRGERKQQQAVDNENGQKATTQQKQRFQLLELNRISVYWDDDPAFMLSGFLLPKTGSEMKQIDSTKDMSRIAAAMEALMTSQDPGESVWKSFEKYMGRSYMKQTSSTSRRVGNEHTYCCEPFSCKGRATFNDDQMNDVPSCFVELLPCEFQCRLYPQQYQQYTTLKSALLRQQRFDTLLHRRPSSRPSKRNKNATRAWWKYIMSCVMSRPQSRPWRDIARIVGVRSRYIALVSKKLINTGNGHGFHGGLSENENDELNTIEGFLPIEVLLAFHLLALRKVADRQDEAIKKAIPPNPKSKERTVSKSPQRKRHNGSSMSRLRNAVFGKVTEPMRDQLLSPPVQPSYSTLTDVEVKSDFSFNSSPFPEDSGKIQLNLIANSSQEDFRFKIHSICCIISLMNENEKSPLVVAQVEANALVRAFKTGVALATLDIVRLNVRDCLCSSDSYLSKILVVGSSKSDELIYNAINGTTQQPTSSDDELGAAFPPSDTGDSNLSVNNEKLNSLNNVDSWGSANKSLVPSRVVSRVSVFSGQNGMSCDISSLPATFVWNKSCLDALSDFFASPMPTLESKLRARLVKSATPLAHKAFIAFSSPSSIAVNINVDAPKLWIPISNRRKDGALYCDAGHLNMSIRKKEREINTNWSIEATSIQMKFISSAINSSTKNANNEIPVVRPFEVKMSAEMVAEGNNESKTEYDTIGTNLCAKTKVVAGIGTIFLNLVDVDILAKAIGKLYAHAVSMTKNRSREPSKRLRSDDQQLVFDEKIQNLLDISVHIEQIEMAIPGYVPPNADVTSKQYSKRTYMVCLMGMVIKLDKIDDDMSVSKSRFDLQNIYIVHTRGPSPNVSLNACRLEPWRLVLSRGGGDNSVNMSSISFIPDRGMITSPEKRDCSKSIDSSFFSFAPEGGLSKNYFISVSYFHDGRKHIDEVEVDIEPLILRVTPTSLRDCVMGLHRITELVRIMGSEMERMVHEGGRLAREKIASEKKKKTRKLKQINTLNTKQTLPRVSADISDNDEPTDSSLILRVTSTRTVILAGRPIMSSDSFSSSRRKNKVNESSNIPAAAVIQSSCNSLLMFQSIENADASGSRTIHLSIDDFSTSVTSKFEVFSHSEVPPIIGPIAAEIRAVYSTENLGLIVSQDFALDCDSIKACFSHDDLRIINNIQGKMRDRLDISQMSVNETVEYNAGARAQPSDEITKKDQQNFVQQASSLFRTKQRGSGVATSIRFEAQLASVVLMHKHGPSRILRPLLDLHVARAKGKLQGCVSAMSGECSSLMSLEYFNAAKKGDWEPVIEPWYLVLAIDQLPDELTFSLVSAQDICFNLTSQFLSDLSEAGAEILSTSSGKRDDLRSNVFCSIDKRRGTERVSITLHNESGLDVDFCPMPFFEVQGGDESLNISRASRSFEVANGKHIDLRSYFEEFELQYLSDIIKTTACPTLAITLSASAKELVGKRKHITNMPITSVENNSMTLHSLSPLHSNDDEENNSFYNYAHVVEWCMQNQRLRSSTSDVYSLQKGEDLLSSVMWSPGDFFFANEKYSDHDNEVDYSLEMDSFFSVDDGDNADAVVMTSKGNWLRPNAMIDAPEWTDMTCVLRMERDRVMLPDIHWIWCNDWTVDLGGTLGENTDADGWEYQYDFETFSRNRRSYKRGDNCRRRRWTRTRMIRPPKLDDPKRALYFVWETKQEKDGDYVVKFRSHLTLHNRSGIGLSFFVYCPSWDKDIYVGFVDAGDEVHVPIQYATATHLRLARKRAVDTKKHCLDDFIFSERLMILPTSYTSTTVQRTFISSDKAADDTRSLHFLVEIECDQGITRISIDPVMRIHNLLPCSLHCQFGQAVPEGKVPCESAAGILTKGRMLFEEAKEDGISIVDPSAKPHISMRVPGYNWSSWYRIVNHKESSGTWIPSEQESKHAFRLNEENGVNVEDFITVIKFDRTGGGDPLHIILSVEQGHCPVLRIYAQYWIVDKTGFGLRFCEGVSILGGSIGDTSRRSFASLSEIFDAKEDIGEPGHQWALGMCGMSLYFSSKEKLSLRIENIGEDRSPIRSSWANAIDISNVMPRTVFSVDEEGGGPRRFELAIEITLCPSVFSRTKLITLYPRYQIVNLLNIDIFVAQCGSIGTETQIPKQTSSPFHWDEASLPPQIRLSAALHREEAFVSRGIWTNGCIQLDRIGITSMRLPVIDSISAMDGGTASIVIQAEVRLASKDQSCAVVVVIWSTVGDNNNPLYLLKNKSSKYIYCAQPLRDLLKENEDGTEVILNVERKSSKQNDYWWLLEPGKVSCYGFEDPERPHLLEWYFTSVFEVRRLSKVDRKSVLLNVDSMGSSTYLKNEDVQICCQIRAENSTKVIEFTDVCEQPNVANADDEENDDSLIICLRVDIPGISISFIDNMSKISYERREILFLSLTNITATFSQGRDGHHEVEVLLETMQLDNHITEATHPVMMFCPGNDEGEPFLHLSAVRRMQRNCSTYVFAYAALRMLDMEIFLDRRTAERIARFVQPLRIASEVKNEAVQDPQKWISKLIYKMASKYSNPNLTKASRNVEQIALSANSGRVYFEHLLLHPIRLSLTFTQEYTEWNSITEGLIVFQIIRAAASLTDAPLMFTSFAVDHAFESPQALSRIIYAHYTSQLTNQIFSMLGSLAILRPGGDFLANVGNGVKDFFYEPINGMMHSPGQFLEGLEVGTQSLARNLVLGISQGAANVAEVVNSNLTTLTDKEFIEERNAHRRMLAEAINRGTTTRSIADSLVHAGSSVALGMKSGARGIVDQPSRYASEHGTIGFFQGVGKGLIGAIVKPVIGIGDAAVLVMQHVSEVTSEDKPVLRNPRRLRRALPLTSVGHHQVLQLISYDDAAAMAQKIVTGGESFKDIYLGHMNLKNDVIVASEEYLWVIDRSTRKPWCLSWEEISHFAMQDNGGVSISFFSSTGLKSLVLQADGGIELADLYRLLSIQMSKMGNSPIDSSSVDQDSMFVNNRLENISELNLPGILSKQDHHLFGSNNKKTRWMTLRSKEDIDVIEQCFARVKCLGSEMTNFFVALDQESWFLIDAWSHVYGGLNSRHRIAAGVINGTGVDIQVKMSRVEEGGSPCYCIPSLEYDHDQNVLHPGGGMIFFAWGSSPSLNQAGKVFMCIETNTFLLNLSDRRSRLTKVVPLPGYQVKFLEKSFDDGGWWAKYWILVKRSS